MLFERLIIPLIEGGYIVFGNVKCFGEYLMQPMSLLGEHFVSSYSNFYGEQIAFSIPRLQLADLLGDVLSLLSRDYPIWIGLAVLVITVGLITSIVVKLVRMISGLL